MGGYYLNWQVEALVEWFGNAAQGIYLFSVKSERIKEYVKSEFGETAPVYFLYNFFTHIQQKIKREKLNCIFHIWLLVVSVSYNNFKVKKLPLIFF
jgi:hypothetical protein